MRIQERIWPVVVRVLCALAIPVALRHTNLVMPALHNGHSPPVLALAIRTHRRVAHHTLP